MTEFNSRFSTVEAKQFDGTDESAIEIMSWIAENGGEARRSKNAIYVPSFENFRIAYPGTWVIMTEHHHFSVESAFSFKKHYELKEN